MALSNELINTCAKRFNNARSRLLLKYPFFGLLLYHIRFGLDEDCQTAYTNSEHIAFNPIFMGELSDIELDFVIMHEIMHVALGHCFRGENYNDQDLFNQACDIVINSTLLTQLSDKSFSTLMDTGLGGCDILYKLPDGNLASDKSAEEVYGILCLNLIKKEKNTNDGEESIFIENDSSGPGQNNKDNNYHGFDEHNHWGEITKENQEAIDKWNQIIKEAAANTLKMNGEIPPSVERYVNSLRNSSVDWRTALQAFIQEIVVDYSFSPPDYRFQNSPFLLPSFSDVDIDIKNIIFMIDTSGSMSDDDITKCYSEINSAIEQFNGRLRGYLGFFDHAVHGLNKFDEINDILKLKPIGGGGTSFHAIFDYLNNKFDEEITSIIILTDGEAPFPSESMANDVPVMWALTGRNNTITPPWGKTIRVDE